MTIECVAVRRSSQRSTTDGLLLFLLLEMGNVEFSFPPIPIKAYSHSHSHEISLAIPIGPMGIPNIDSSTYNVSKKKVGQNVLSYLLQNSVDSDKSWYVVSVAENEIPSERCASGRGT